MQLNSITGVAHHPDPPLEFQRYRYRYRRGDSYLGVAVARGLHRIEEYGSSCGVSTGDSPDPQRTFVSCDANLGT